MEEVRELAKSIAKEPALAEYHHAHPRLLLVGGVVRDSLRGLESTDIDVEIFGVPPARVEVIVQQLFGTNVRSVGQSFGILSVFLEHGRHIDIAIPRRDRKVGHGHRGFTIESDPSLSIKEALRRRDFTCNSLAQDPLTGELIDPFDGTADLASGVLRITDADHFSEDPLRIYRALQIAARFSLTVEPTTEALLKKMIEDGEHLHVTVERVTEEIKKLLLKAERPSIGLELARSIGLLPTYPELLALIDVPQEPEWHPEGDVWTHTLMVVDQAARIIRRDAIASTEQALTIMLGALCHDLGKPATTELIDGRIRSRGHSEAGIKPARSLLGLFCFSAAMTARIEHCVREHLQLGLLERSYASGTLTEEAYINAIRRLIKRIAPTPWQTLVAVSEADARGRGRPNVQTGPYQPGEHCIEVIRSYHLDTIAQIPLVSGDDLLQIGLVPGPLMGRAIAYAETLRDEGKISTKTQALDEIREWLERPASATIEPNV